MNQPDTSDLYKFYATLGLLIIALSFLFLWTISTANDIFLISNEDLEKITVLAKENILKKQEDLSWLYGYRYIIFLLTMGLGILFFSHGILKWIPKQELIDIREEITSQTANQIDSRLRDEAREAVDAESSLKNADNTSDHIYINCHKNEEKPNLKSIINIINSIGSNKIKMKPSFKNSVSIDNYVNEYKNIEERVFKAINNKYKNSYEIKSNAKFKDAEYDIIMLPIENTNSSIINIEIKYYTRMNYTFLLSGYRRFLISANKFNRHFENVEYKLLWIYNNDGQFEKLKEYKKVLEISSEYKSNIKIDINIINKNEIDEFNYI